ncbi:2-hydroxychromene-2-carboxylate isomerase [Sulfitobacter sp. BDSS02]|nr:2-hydroxychromene-2-carboxylate isomerase [Sulfitobacter sp. BDSS02]MBR9848938.1 2-hydroxychromene-2-carboxylate isomerase [Paracoccaceae bacterium]
MAQIDYFFATLSPFAYLAGTRLEQIAARHEATVVYKPFDIISLFSRTGTALPKDRPVARQEYRMQELKRQAKHLQMKMNFKPAHFPTNAALSSYAIIAAQAEGGGDVGVLSHAVLRACWAEDKDIADDAVIRACLEEAGFDPAIADRSLLQGAETYAANLEEAISRGVFGSPFYITEDDERFWGQDRLDALDTHLEEASA